MATNKYRTLQNNYTHKGKRYIIADIHGCYNTLKSLITRLKLKKEDEIYFLGDYIDNGLHSKLVIDFIINLKHKHKVYCLKGNHEQYYQDWKNHDPYGLKDKNGVFLPQYQKFWEELYYYIELHNAILVHASINFKSVNPFEDYETMLHKSSKSMYTLNNTGKLIIRGHSKKPISFIKEAVKNQANVIPLDNGCHRNTDAYKYLCALELNSFELIMEEFISHPLLLQRGVIHEFL